MTYSSELPEQVPLEGLTLDLSKSVVPNLFGTRDQFCGRQFFCGPGGKQAERASVLSATHLLLCHPVPNRPQIDGCQFLAGGRGEPLL